MIGFGTPDTIRTCDLQSRSYQAASENACVPAVLGDYKLVLASVAAPANHCYAMVCGCFDSIGSLVVK